MKTIGIVGGMSWESTARYYKLINKGIKEKLGELHSAKILMHSIDFYELEELQRNNKWSAAMSIILQSVKRLEKAKADFIIICSVTGHEGADMIQARTHIPLLHIADTINEKIVGLKKVGLLGTISTMEMSYFKDKLNTEVIIPKVDERKIINDTIYKELCIGEIKHSSRDIFKYIIKDLAHRGTEGVILGCTEIGLLINQWDCNIPIFDITEIHAKAAVDYSLKGDK